jgi:hypothetical protein
MNKVINNKKNHTVNHFNRPNRNNNVQDDQVDLKLFNINELFDMAEKAYLKNTQANTNDRWNQIIAKSGTRKDKISLVAS